jgi:hypothetical protein
VKPRITTIIAFIAVPIIPAAGLAMLTDWSFNSFWLVLLYYPHALIITSALSVPAYFIGKWLGLIRWWSALTVGLFIGTLFGYWLMEDSVYGPGLVTPLFFAENVFWLTAFGGLSGFVFWWVWSVGHRADA